MRKEELLGRSIFELEKLHVFYPSAAVKVLRTKSKITMLQKNKLNNEILVTAIPIKDDNNCIIKVVCFSYYIQTFLEIKKQFKVLERNGEIYKERLSHLVYKGINPNLMMGKNKEMKKIFNLITKIADFDVNCLITGESGVGKSYFVKLIYSVSKSPKRRFIELNCGAIPEHLLESELFGYEGGAFTGAKKEGKPGLIELSDNGTLFLDEIGELNLDMQVKLLRVLQEREIKRVGGTDTIKIDVRIIAATNRNLEKMVAKKTFREDLYYRLNVVPITILPLRERKDDIEPLINYFMGVFNKKYDFNKVITRGAVDSLKEYRWPGNVRELRNIIERVIIMSTGDKILRNDLPIKEIWNSNISDTDIWNKNLTLKEVVEDLEESYIENAFKKYGNVRDAAKELGINASTLVRKRKRYRNKNVLQK